MYVDALPHPTVAARYINDCRHPRGFNVAFDKVRRGSGQTRTQPWYSHAVVVVVVVLVVAVVVVVVVVVLVVVVVGGGGGGGGGGSGGDGSERGGGGGWKWLAAVNRGPKGPLFTLRARVRWMAPRCPSSPAPFLLPLFSCPSAVVLLPRCSMASTFATALALFSPTAGRRCGGSGLNPSTQR